MYKVIIALLVLSSLGVQTAQAFPSNQGQLIEVALQKRATIHTRKPNKAVVKVMFISFVNGVCSFQVRYRKGDGLTGMIIVDSTSSTPSPIIEVLKCQAEQALITVPHDTDWP